MNFRILLHLFATEWLRLRKPVILLWILIAIMTALSLADHRGDFAVPSWSMGSVGNRMDIGSRDGRADIQLSFALDPLAISGSILFCFVAAAIGSHSKTWLRVSPARPRERVGAKLLALLVLLVLPGSMASAVNLAFQDFSFDTILLAAAGYTIGGLLVAGITALFAAWCGSIWRWIVAMIALAACHLVFASALREDSRLFTSPWRVFGRMWDAGTGGEIGLVAGMILLGVTFPLVRRGWPSTARISIAVALLVTSFVVIQPAGMKWLIANATPAGRSIQHAAVESYPVVRGLAVADQDSGSGIGLGSTTEAQWRITGFVGTREIPVTHGISWRPSGGRIIRDGKIAADLSFIPSSFESLRGIEVDFQRGFASRSLYFIPDASDPATLSEITKALPGKIPPVMDDLGAPRTRPANFGTVVPRSDAPRWMGKGATLEIPFRGTIYRYQKIIDTPLTKTPVVIREGEVTYRVRGTAREGGEPFIEISVTHPSLGFSSLSDHMDWGAPPTTDCRLFLHLPATAKTYPLERTGTYGGPLLYGAGWHWQFYQVPLRLAPQIRFLNTDGARLILLKPIVLGTVPPVTVRADLDPITENWSIRDYVITARSTNLKENQSPTGTTLPHPLKAEAPDFSRWLRRDAGLDEYQSQPAAPNLALFAPRFTGLLLKAADFPAAAEAIQIATPESDRDAVIARFKTTIRPIPLLDTINSRGWTRQAAAAIRDRVLEGDLRPGVTGVLIAEDPLTYPTMIEGLLHTPDLELYERMRLLPGIEPALGNAIAAQLQDESRLLAEIVAGHRSPGIFLLAAKNGSPQGLKEVISMFRNLPDNREVAASRDRGRLRQLFYISPDWDRYSGNLATYLSRQKPEDFAYDPILRLWMKRGKN